jgi:enamine deaminase RidA (YjgF/YER057c/UK114 family)
MNREIINPETVAAPAGPYANAIKVTGAGGFVFIAGMPPADLQGNIVSQGDILGQTRQVVKNIIANLEAAGARPENVVKTTTYVVDSEMKNFFTTGASVDCLKAFNHPTDTLIGVASLAGSNQGQLIEVTAMAVIDRT